MTERKKKREKQGPALNYIETGSFFHRLNSLTKFILFLFWTGTVLTTFDLRIILPTIFLGIIFLKISKIPFKVYRVFFFLMLYMTFVNTLVIFLIEPLQGVKILGSRTDLFVLNRHYPLTLETLLYLLVVSLKYLSIFLVSLLFVFTTHPGRLASGLNRIGIPYKIAYTVNLTLRYLPGITDNFYNILYSQQAKGADFSKNVSFLKRIRNLSSILIPLIFSSLEKAENIVHAMELRGFGKKKRRTWYNRKKLQRKDKIIIGLLMFLFLFSLFQKKGLGSFWNPFSGLGK